MKKIIKIITSSGLASLSLLGTTTTVFADEARTFNLSPTGQFSGLAGITLPAMVRSLLVLGLVLAGIVALGFLIYGGIVWITSGGDKAKTEQARNTITAALVGLLIVFGAWAIIQLVQMFFDIPILQLNLEPFTARGGTAGGS